MQQKLIADSRGINIVALTVGGIKRKDPCSQSNGKMTIFDNIIWTLLEPLQK